MRRGLVGSLVVATIAVGCAAEVAPAAARGPRGEVREVEGLLAVDWRDGTTKAEFDAEERAFGIDVELNSVHADDEAITIAKGVEVTDALLARLRANPRVERAERVYVYERSFVPNDPEYELQWHLAQVGAEKAWEWGAGAEVTVAVIDTGVSRLADLEATKFVKGYDFVNDDEDAEDDHGHGSHVAGTIAQSTHNEAGVAGLAHRAAIMPVKVLGASGGGTTVDIADAIRWAADHGAKVLNLSLGGGGYSEILADAVKYATSKGAVVICAAGNGFGPPVNYPAAYDGAVAVSAVRFDRALAPYSSYGPEVDLAGPGGDKSVDQNKDGHPDGVYQQTLKGFEWYQGTSMATPHVAGAAALLASVGVTRADAIVALLQRTAVDLKDREKFGAGEIDAGAAVKYVRLWGGFWRLAIAVLFTFFATRVLKRRGEVLPGIGVVFGLTLLLASAGLMLLPLVGSGHSSVAAFLASPVPEWGHVLHGASHSSPLWLSAIVPFLALGVSRLRPLAGAMAGLAIGWAAYLAHAAATGWVDIAFVPGRTVEIVFLAVNALLALGFGTLALRQARR